jgi:cytochrome c-type biogenesis protein CcmH
VRLSYLLVAAFALAILLITVLWAPPVLAEGSVDQQTMEIARLLRCPVCQNLSVADSPSPLAGQMRDIIRQKVVAGESRDQILAYFVGVYGEGILNYPPASGFSGLAWWGAAAIPLAGIALSAVYLRRRLGVAVAERPGVPEEEPW